MLDEILRHECAEWLIATEQLVIGNLFVQDGLMIDFDDAGSIGKRYRREDEIGTPICITYDFDSENDNCVTVRDRDTMEQERIPISELKNYISEKISF